MKRILLFLLMLALLAGCTAVPDETTPTTEPTAPAPGIYDAGHSLEIQSNGAVRVFPLEGNCDAIGFFGKTLMTFAKKGEGTVLTPFTGVNLTQQTGTTLWGSFLPEDKDIRLEQGRIGYFNPTENCIVFLDSGFQETGRIRLPQDMVGKPVLSESMAVVFYSTDTEIRALSLESGINRLIRKQDCHSISVEGVMFADSVLMCAVTDHDGSSYAEFISSQTGETLGIDRSCLQLNDWENRYFLQRQDGLVTEYIFTAADGSQQCFHPETDGQVYSLLSANAVATVTAEEQGVTLALYDLSEGKRTAQITLEGVEAAYGLAADPEQEIVWFLCRQIATGKTLLCGWDLEKSPCLDSAVHTAPRYTAANPDTDGLAACREKANTLEQRFSVKIYFYNEPLEGKDYALSYEHQPAVILSALEQLENAMSIFPEGFLVTAAEVSDNKQIHIGLVRGLKSKNTGVPDGLEAVQYWVNGDAWMALSVGEHVQQLFYHELAHVLDSFVYSKTVAYDEWIKLNPKDFEYDLSYWVYKDRSTSPYLEGSKRAFIDSYSMTYPKEDRARIFECALEEGNEALFASKTMQSKLRQFCTGIRLAYGWKKDARSFPWEQYLETPLAYTKK